MADPEPIIIFYRDPPTLMQLKYMYVLGNLPPYIDFPNWIESPSILTNQLKYLGLSCSHNLLWKLGMYILRQWFSFNLNFFLSSISSRFADHFTRKNSQYSICCWSGWKCWPSQLQCCKSRGYWLNKECCKGIF